MSGTTKRRDFLKSSLLATSAVFHSGLRDDRVNAEEKIEPKNPFSTDPLAMRVVTPNVRATRLGLGTGMAGYARSSELTRLGHDEAIAMIRYCYDCGIRLFDTADIYGSHPFVGEALKDKPRDSYTLISKTWPHEGEISEILLDPEKAVEGFLKDLRTDYIDLVQIHCMSAPNWPESFSRHVEGLERLKEQGKIRSHGVSCHGIEAIRTAVAHPWVDAIHFRINSKENRMDGTLEENQQLAWEAQKNGKGVIVMKVLGGGQITDPVEQKESIRTVACNDSTDVMVVAFKTREQVDFFLNTLTDVLSEEVRN